jgi:hypothetical protein
MNCKMKVYPSLTCSKIHQPSVGIDPFHILPKPSEPRHEQHTPRTTLVVSAFRSDFIDCEHVRELWYRIGEREETSEGVAVFHSPWLVTCS